MDNRNGGNGLFGHIGRLWLSVWKFYADGFRNMTMGRSLWALILIKIAILFLVFKLLFFPDILRHDYPDDESRARAVRAALTDSDRQQKPSYP